MARDREYFDQLVLDVKRKLPEYLQSLGRTVSPSRTFQCVMPERHKHGDSSFSANITQQDDGAWVWHCFPCKEGGTVFDMVNILEGLPVAGSGFLTTLVELATRFGIGVDYERLGITQREMEVHYSVQDIYTEIEIYLRTYGDGIANLQNGRFGRTYTEEQAQKVVSWVAMGCVDAKQLQDHLSNKFGAERIQELPFYSKDEGGAPRGIDANVFGKDLLTMTIKTYYGKIVGFCARISKELQAKASEDGKKVMKYKFTYGMAGKKDDAMFLLHTNRREIKEAQRAKIVEGPFDAISMKLAGDDTVAALHGSSFTESHADILAQLKVSEVVFVLDPDQAGLRGLRKALDVLKNYDIVASATPLPEGFDPDRVVSEGMSDLFGITQDAIDFVLERDPQFSDPAKNPDVLYEEMISFTARVATSLARLRRYAERIAGKSSFVAVEVLEDLQRRRDRQETRGHEAQSIWNDVKRAENMSIPERAAVLKKAHDSYTNLIAGSSGTVMRDTWDYYLGLVRNEYQLPEIIHSGFQFLDKATTFQCGTLTIVGGRPSNGKSSFIRHLILQMLKVNPDLYTLYISIDDPVETAMIAFLSIITGMTKDETQARLRGGTLIDAPEVRSVSDQIRSLFSESMCLKGSIDCSSVMAIRKTLYNIKSLTKKKVVLVVDAMNNLADISKEDQRIAIENTVRDFKFLAVETDSNIILVSHLTKMDTTRVSIQRPTLASLKGTSFLEFEAKNIILCHMDMHYDANTTMGWNYKGFRYPIVEINVAKDKERSANEVIPFLFDPIHGTFEEPEESKLAQYRTAIRLSISGKQGSDGPPAEGESFM